MHLNIVETTDLELLANIFKIRRFDVTRLDQGTTGKFNRIMQSATYQKEHREQKGDQRNDVEDQGMAHEGDVAFDAEKFHDSLPITF